MDFISNGKTQIEEMLAAIGIQDIDQLFKQIPQELKVPRFSLDDGLSEMEGMRFMEEVASKNTFPHLTSYLGAGAYEHHIPVLAGSICAKGEFLTSYTPYQAEASQGMLQLIFEFQSCICAITGMDVSNASLYDGAHACAEALLMSLRCQKDRNKVVVASSLHPHYREVVKQFLSSHSTEIVFLPFGKEGQVEQQAIEELIDKQTAAVLIQSPNFFGVIEQVKHVSAKAKQCGALTVLCGNPMSYCLYAPPSELGVDIAVGDVQPLGLPLQFGGPYVGYLACKKELMRQVPGRIVGQTVDKEKKRGFVLTLQAREQHIRREKATSNVCTNQALAALSTLVTMLWYGKKGLHQVALTNFQRTSYLRDALEAIPNVKIMGPSPFFNEFAVDFGIPVHEVLDRFKAEGIVAGLDLGRFFSDLKGYILVAVTETKSKRMLDHYIKTAKKL